MATFRSRNSQDKKRKAPKQGKKIVLFIKNKVGLHFGQSFEHIGWFFAQIIRSRFVGLSLLFCDSSSMEDWFQVLVDKGLSNNGTGAEKTLTQFFRQVSQQVFCQSSWANGLLHQRCENERCRSKKAAKHQNPWESFNGGCQAKLWDRQAEADHEKLLTRQSKQCGPATIIVRQCG